MEMLLLPPQEPFLRYKNLVDIIDEHPQSENNKINYVVAGGGAVMLLLESTEVNGYKIIDVTADNRRKHKDLELYVFNNESFLRFHKNPHDLVDFTDSKLHRVDYKREPPCAELMIELLTGVYYDFLIPTVKDITKVITSRGTELLTLRPEFLIASKLFTANGMRAGVDDCDALALLKRFELDFNYLSSLAERSELNSFMDLQNSKRFSEDLESKIFFENIAGKIDEKYGLLLPELSFLDYGEKVSVARYDLEDLVLSKEQNSLITSAFLSILDGDFPVYIITEDKTVKSAYFLCLRYLFSEFYCNKIKNYNCLSKLDKENVQKIYKILLRSDSQKAIATASGIKRVLKLAKNVYKPITDVDKVEFNKFTSIITNKILFSYYMHAITSALSKRLSEKMEQGCESLDYKDLVKGF